MKGIPFNQFPISRFHRYIYGHPINYPLTDLDESYMAADKYLLHQFSEAFFEYIERKLNPKNSCLIFEQLVKIGGREERTLAHVKRTIVECSKKAFESEHFMRIDQETLISLLSLDELSIDEIDLVTAVSKWVDCEVQRQGLSVNRENRRKVFEQIKGYILFAALAPESLANCKEIVGLFTAEEIGLLCLHLLNKEFPLTIKPETPRRAGAYARSVFVAHDSIFPISESFDSEWLLLEMSLTVNRRVSVRTIHTTYSQSAYHMSLDIRGLKAQKFKMKRFMKDDKWSFAFEPPVVLEPNFSYKLLVNAEGDVSWEDELTEQTVLDYKGSVIFTVGDADFPCIRGLDFSISD